MPGGASQTRLVASAVTEKKVSRRGTHTQVQRKGQVKQHRRNKGPSWLRPALFCLGTSSYAGVCMGGSGRGKPAHVDTGDLALFARNRNILRILPGVGPVVIHPQASPDAHLCCGSTLHTMTGARARLSPSSFHPYPPPLLSPPLFLSFRDLLVVCKAYISVSFCAT